MTRSCGCRTASPHHRRPRVHRCVCVLFRSWRVSAASRPKQCSGPVATLLEIRAEPHLELLAIESVNIRKARDHNGKLLEPSSPVARRSYLNRSCWSTLRVGPRWEKASWMIVWLPGLATCSGRADLAGIIEARFLVRRNCLACPPRFQAVGNVRRQTRRSLAVRARRCMTTAWPRSRCTSTIWTACSPLRPRATIYSASAPEWSSCRPTGRTARWPGAARYKGRPLPREKFVPPDAAEVRITFANVPQDGKGLRLVLMAWQTVRMEVEFALGK